MPARWLVASTQAQGSAGTARMPQTTQTTPQEGSLGGTAGGRAGANAGQGTTQTVPGNNAGAPRGGGGEASDRQVPQHMQERGHTSTQGQGQGGRVPGQPGEKKEQPRHRTPPRRAGAVRPLGGGTPRGDRRPARTRLPPHQTVPARNAACGDLVHR